jgi:hypothetical protein
MPHSSSVRRTIVASAWIAATILAASCATSISRGSDASTLTIALTDSASDEISSFVVDITRIQLLREDKVVVDLLASPFRIDLSALTEISRGLAVLYGPPALYTRLGVTIDYTHASCMLVGKSVAATILDGDGNALTGPVTYSLEAGGDIPAVAGLHRVVGSTST